MTKIKVSSTLLTAYHFDFIQSSIRFCGWNGMLFSFIDNCAWMQFNLSHNVIHSNACISTWRQFARDQPYGKCRETRWNNLLLCLSIALILLYCWWVRVYLTAAYLLLSVSSFISFHFRKVKFLVVIFTCVHWIIKFHIEAFVAPALCRIKT